MFLSQSKGKFKVVPLFKHCEQRTFCLAVCRRLFKENKSRAQEPHNNKAQSSSKACPENSRGLCTGHWLKEAGAGRHTCVLISPMLQKTGIVITALENRLNCIKELLFPYNFLS